MSALRAAKSFSDNVTRVFISSNSQQSWMAKLSVPGPLNEADLNDDLWADPVGAQARQADGAREWWLGNLKRVEFATQVSQQFVVEASADFAGENEFDALRIDHPTRAARVGTPVGRATAPMPARYRRRF